MRIFVGGDLVWEGVIDKVSEVLSYFGTFLAKRYLLSIHVLG